MNLSLNKKEDKVFKEKNKKYEALLKKIEVFSTRYFEALVAVLVLIIFLLGAIFILNPKYKKIVEEEAYSQEDLQGERTDLDKYLSKLKEYKSAYQKLSEVSRSRVDGIVPEEAYLENLFATIESITKKQGVVIKALAVNNSLENEGAKGGAANVHNAPFEEAMIKLSVTGVDYNGIKKLLKVFENNLRLMDVKDIKFNLDAKTAEFVIYTYFINK